MFRYTCLCLLFFLGWMRMDVRAQHPADSTIVAVPVLIKLMENPVKQKARLLASGFQTGTAWLQVQDAAGHVVYRAQRVITGNREEIVFFCRWTPGIYTCMLMQEKRRAVVRMVVAY
jgi:hypothetical protein